MEMDSNPITKPSKKGTILSVAFYVLAAVLLITAFVSPSRQNRQEKG